VLGDSTGSLVVDAYTGYNEVTRPARRKFFEARTTAPEGEEALAIITEIYRVEQEAKAAGISGTAAHLAMRQERSRPLMDRFFCWLEEQKPNHVPKSPMGKAIRYALGNWQALTRFLDDANSDPDNNKAEGALRRVAFGRKNFLHVGPEDCVDALSRQRRRTWPNGWAGACRISRSQR
jgi:transposase